MSPALQEPSKQTIRVALAHPDDRIVAQMTDTLRKEPGPPGFEVVRVGSVNGLLRVAATGQIAAIILALDLEGREDVSTVAKLQAKLPKMPVIVVQRIDSNLGVEAVRLGARDCLSETETDSPRLARSIRIAIIVQERRNIARHDIVLFDNLLENIPERIYFKDRQSRFIRANQAMADIFRLNHVSELIGKTDFDFFTAEHAQPAFDDEQLLINEREPKITKVEKETFPDGRVRWALTTKMPLRSPEGRIIGTFGISHDITKLRETEAALENERNQLRATSDELAEKNRVMAEDLDMAQKVQLALLPRSYPTFPQEADESTSLLRFDHRYIPAQAVGGDFFTIFPVSPTKAGILVCDVMGHGPRAALITAIIRTLREEIRSRANNPGEFLSGLNAGLLRVLQDVDVPVFCTAFYMVVDSAGNEVEFSCAAHPSPIHLKRRERTAVPLRNYDERRGPGLGLFENEVFPNCRFELEPSDLLLLYTDGLVEVTCEDQQEFGVDRLIRQLEASAQLETGPLLDATLDAVRRIAITGFEDDVCLVSVEKAVASAVHPATV